MKNCLKISALSIRLWNIESVKNFLHWKLLKTTMMRIIARSSLAKNFMTKHKVETFKRGRANIGGLKISEYYGAIDELSDDFTPKQLANAVFVITGVVHDKAMINPEQCDIGAFMNLALWLDSALPWSKTGKYQRIKQYKVNELSGSMINARNIVHYRKG